MKTNKTIRFCASFFIASLFLGAALKSLVFAETYAYPVPYVEKQSPSQNITFKELPGEGTIKIFTVSGEEVKNLDVANGQLTRPWDLTNNSGERVATGVYFYQVNAGGKRSSGKLVVIR